MKKNAKIDSEGYLHAFRNGKWKQQYCHSSKNTKCGDWCPLFREYYGLQTIGMLKEGALKEFSTKVNFDGIFLVCQNHSERTYLATRVVPILRKKHEIK